MKIRVLQSLIGAIAFCAAAGAQDISHALNAIKGYEFGQSRQALDQVAALVVASLDQPQQQAVADALTAVLESDASLECKRFVLRQLAVAATPANVEGIAPFLLDPELSDMARYALQPIDDPSVDRAVLRALANASEPEMKVGMITTLGARGSETAIPALKKHILADDEMVARSAAAALGRIGGVKAARALAAVKRKAAPEVAADLSNAQLMVADTLLAAGDRAKAAAIYESLVDAREPDTMRKAAFIGVAKSGGLEGSSEAWRKRLDEDPVLREAAAGYLHTTAAQYERKAEEELSK